MPLRAPQARRLGTRPEATGPAGRSRWAEGAGGPLLGKGRGPAARRRARGGREVLAPPQAPAPGPCPRRPTLRGARARGLPRWRGRRVTGAVAPSPPRASRSVAGSSEISGAATGLAVFFLSGLEDARLPELGLAQPCFFLRVLCANKFWSLG